jgi:precorrin-6B methylase 2
MEWRTRLAAYVRYRLRAEGPHDIHSPFIFEFLNDVILDKTPFYAFEPLESLRSKLSLDRRELLITDLGSGSKKEPEKRRKVCDITRGNLLPGPYARILFRAVNRFRPRHLLELGTSLGITTLHLAMPDASSLVYTLEGCPQTAAVAQEQFDRLKADNIRLVTGDFATTLHEVLLTLKRVDFAFIDGNHRMKPTLDYFEQLLACCHEDTVLVFDDIHWSREMENSWKAIRSHPRVTITADLYRMGFVFFRTGVEKQHFTLKS